MLQHHRMILSLLEYIEKEIEHIINNADMSDELFFKLREHKIAFTNSNIALKEILDMIRYYQAD